MEHAPYRPGEWGFVSEAAAGRAVGQERSRLLGVLDANGIEVDEDVADRLLYYLDIVLEKNEHLNLTSIRDWDRALVLHLADSLTFLKELDEQPHDIRVKPFLDMGCGAGFPGIPVAIARPDRGGMLCDSVQKKARAVEEFVRALGLEKRLSVDSERLEVLGTNRRRSFGCLMARAVAPLPVLVEYAAPLLSRHGLLVVSKGTPDEAELSRGEKAAALCGLEVRSVRRFELAGGFGQRKMIVYGKVAEPELKLPRPIGMAGKEPLA